MHLLLVYAVTLFVAVLISGIARTTVLSVAVLFLASGIAAGAGWLGMPVSANPEVLDKLAQFALFSVLFTDGMRTGGIAAIRREWHLAARALLGGMLLTIAGIAALAHFMAQLPWSWAFLIAAVLSPTDPVFVSVIFDVEEVPVRIKRLLNVESGLNDGLALPVVLLLLARVGTRHASLGELTGSLLLGIGLGVVIPLAGVYLQRRPIFTASGVFESLNAFALGLVVLAVAYVSGANLFLAAFAAGVTIISAEKQVADAFRHFGEIVAELMKLAALLVFGALLAPRLFDPIPPLHYVFIILAVFVVRMVAISISLIHSGPPLHEILTVGWFGPKGFASVVYGLLVLSIGTATAREVAHLIALGVASSIVVYSSTDVLMAAWYRRKRRLVAFRSA
jgi:sodium/hydrogen antiporter